MKTRSVVHLLMVLLVCFASVTYASDGGIESLRQTGKAFASVARTVSPSVLSSLTGSTRS